MKLLVVFLSVLIMAASNCLVLADGDTLNMEGSSRNLDLALSEHTAANAENHATTTQHRVMMQENHHTKRKEEKVLHRALSPKKMKKSPSTTTSTITAMGKSTKAPGSAKGGKKVAVAPSGKASKALGSGGAPTTSDMKAPSTKKGAKVRRAQRHLEAEA